VNQQLKDTYFETACANLDAVTAQRTLFGESPAAPSDAGKERK
jgi:hypothetical protein